MIFSTGKRRGQQRKAATIVTSDITKGNSKLTLHSNIRPADDSISLIKIDPPIVDIKKDQRQEKFSVTITNLSEMALTPQLVSKPHEAFELEYSQQAVDPGKSTTLSVWVAEDLAAQTVKKSLTFELDDAKRTRFTIPLQLSSEVDQPLKAASGDH